MIRRFPSLREDWQKNNAPLLFIMKNIMIFSFAIRMANMAMLDYSQFGFYLTIVTFIQYILEILSGKSLIEILLKKLKLFYQQRKNAKNGKKIGKIYNFFII